MKIWSTSPAKGYGSSAKGCGVRNVKSCKREKVMKPFKRPETLGSFRKPQLGITAKEPRENYKGMQKLN